METGTKVSIGALIALIATFLLVGPTDNEPNFACLEDEKKAYCDRLSGSERTCYPYEGSRIGSKLCSGTWIEIPSIVIVETIISNRVHCNNKGCS